MAEETRNQYSNRLLSDTRSKIWLASILISFFLLTQFSIFMVNSDAWFDVAFSLETVHHMREQGFNSIDWAHYDVHAEGYYDVLYFWSYLNPGMNEYQWARELSVMFGLIFITFVFFTLTSLFGEVGSAATFLLSLCSTYIHYAVECRQYIVLLALSAIIVYLIIVNRCREWFGFSVAAFCIFLLPFFHYLAAIASGFFVWLYILMDISERKFKYHRAVILLLVLAASVGFVAAHYALPQANRIAGTWFDTPNISSWPSALLFSFFMTDNYPASAWLSILYYGVLFGFVFVAYQLNKNFKFDDERLGWFMFTSIFVSLIPFFALILIPLFGKSFSNLYHHRFFLVVTWMFAAGLLVTGLRYSKKLFPILVIMYHSAQAHHELTNLIAHTPCDNETIVHESPFSSLTYEVYARQLGCPWRNVVSTNLSLERLNGGGGDAMNPDNIYFNHTLPLGSFYYVMSDGNVPVGNNVKLIYADDGVNLTYVTR
jgi:hypothetical protein